MDKQRGGPRDVCAIAVIAFFFYKKGAEIRVHAFRETNEKVLTSWRVCDCPTVGLSYTTNTSRDDDPSSGSWHRTRCYSSLVPSSFRIKIQTSPISTLVACLNSPSKFIPVCSPDHPPATCFLFLSLVPWQRRTCLNEAQPRVFLFDRDSEWRASWSCCGLWLRLSGGPRQCFSFYFAIPAAFVEDLCSPRQAFVTLSQSAPMLAIAFLCLLGSCVGWSVWKYMADMGVVRERH